MLEYRQVLSIHDGRDSLVLGEIDSVFTRGQTFHLPMPSYGSTLRCFPSVWLYLYRSFRRQCERIHTVLTIPIWLRLRLYIRKRACYAPPWVIHGIYSPVPTRVLLRLFCSVLLHLLVLFFLPRPSVPNGLLSPSLYFRLSSCSLLLNAQPFFRPHTTICEERAVKKHVFYACSYRLFRSFESFLAIYRTYSIKSRNC